jgi:folate-dependent tRNA-U54 methylase TrmFO/GidA
MEARMESFTGCKVFTTTLARDREAMSDKITQWLQAHPDLEIVDKTVTLSSDRQFHCLSIVFFYRERGGAR